MEPWHVGLPGTKLLNKYRFNFTINSYFNSALIPLFSTSSKLFTAHKMTYAMAFPVHTNLLKLVLKARKFDHLRNTYHIYHFGINSVADQGAREYTEP